MPLNEPEGLTKHCQEPNHNLARDTVDLSRFPMKVYWTDVKVDDYLKYPTAFTEVGNVEAYGAPLTFAWSNEIVRVPLSVRLGGPSPGTARGDLYFLAAAQQLRNLCRLGFKQHRAIKTLPENSPEADVVTRENALTSTLYFAYTPAASAIFPWWPALVSKQPSSGGAAYAPGTDGTYSDGACFSNLTDPPNEPSSFICALRRARIDAQAEGGGYIATVFTPGGDPVVIPIPDPFFPEDCFLASDALNFVIGGFMEHNWGIFDPEDPVDPDSPDPGTLTGPSDLWPYFLNWANAQYPRFHRYRTLIIRQENLEWLHEDPTQPPSTRDYITVQRIKNQSELVINAIFSGDLGFSTPLGFELATTNDGRDVSYYTNVVAQHFNLTLS